MSVCSLCPSVPADAPGRGAVRVPGGGREPEEAGEPGSAPEGPAHGHAGPGPLGSDDERAARIPQTQSRV